VSLHLARSLTCERCGGPIAFQAPFCSYCRAPLAWGASLEVAPGPAIETLDLRTQPLPGEDAVGNAIERVPAGRLLTVDGSVSYSGTTITPLRDACVSLAANCYEPNVGFGVAGRVLEAAHASIAYAVVVHPGVRAYRVHRTLWTKTESYIDVIRNWEVAPAVSVDGGPRRRVTPRVPRRMTVSPG
jgi:hypothetical protein